MLSSLSITFIRNFPNRFGADMMYICKYASLSGDLQLNCVKLSVYFPNLLGKVAAVFLASAELAAVAAIEGNIAID
jgi:aconitase B